MRYKLLFLVSMWGYDAQAVLWPSISDPIIVSCEDGFTPCSKAVRYSHSGRVFLNQPELIKPPSGGSIHVRAYGVHCESGSALPGYESPFKECHWDEQSYNAHAPPTRVQCQRESPTSWKIIPYGQTCSTESSWGIHNGAGPGGECVLFGIMQGGILYTPMGAMEATTAANSGSNFCVKPLPPQTKCDVVMDDTILDHGVLGPIGFSTTSVTGVIKCGEKPTVEFVGGADYNIGPGINGQLRAEVDINTNRIRINSHVNTLNAKAGDYQLNKVIVISPW